MGRDQKPRDDAAVLDSPAFLQLLQTQHGIAGGIEEVAAAVRSGAMDLAVADLRRRYTEVPDFVAPGVHRAVVGTPGFGGTTPLVLGVPAQLVGRNTSRLGGQIVNSGVGAVVLYLCTLEDQISSNQAFPQIWLAANGGAWDFRLGNVLWCGTVVAVAAANSSVSVAEV